MSKFILTPDSIPGDQVIQHPTVVKGFKAGSVIETIKVHCHRTPDAEFMLRIDDSHITIKQIELMGLDVLTSKAEWVEKVASGLSVLGQYVTIDHVKITGVHTGIVLRGKASCVNSGSITDFSGDGIQAVEDYTGARNIQHINSIQRFPFHKHHRDIVQAFKLVGGVLKGCFFENITYTHDSDEPPPQGICGFDGEYHDLTITNCKIYGVNNEHGVSFGCVHNSTITNTSTDSTIRFGDRKTGKVGSNNYVSPDCEAAQIIFEDGSQKTAQLINKKVVNMDLSENGRIEWLEGLKNTNAPAIEEQDYIDAAARLNCEVASIKAVFEVESSSSGYNRDGSAKTLLERHLVRREVKKRKLPLKEIANVLGSNLLSRWVGGHKGGIAEYWRIGQTILGVIKALKASRVFNNNSAQEIQEIATDVALSSASWGRPQILGRNCKLAGYETAAEMVEDFHKSEKAHLDAFVSFVENTGLDKHLRNKQWKKFAKGYNGKNCCDKGSKRDYSALIAAEYQRFSDEPVEFKPIAQSRIIQGNTGSIVAGGSASVISFLELKEQSSELISKITDVKASAVELGKSVIELKDQATEIVAANSELITIVGKMEWSLYALGGALAISLILNVYALYARIDDRNKGKN